MPGLAAVTLAVLVAAPPSAAPSPRPRAKPTPAPLVELATPAGRVAVAVVRDDAFAMTEANVAPGATVEVDVLLTAGESK
jgi:hypothetical protein